MKNEIAIQYNALRLSQGKNKRLYKQTLISRRREVIHVISDAAKAIVDTQPPHWTRQLLGILRNTIRSEKHTITKH